MGTKIVNTILWLCLCLLLASCVQKMGKRGHLESFDRSSIPGHPSLVRAPPDGTVARENLQLDNVYFRAKDSAGHLVARNPLPITAALLKRGQERFNINCAPCHGYAGYGDGMIVQRGFLAPPSYHQERLRSAPDGHFFDVISNGYGAMYSYADRVSVADRWAIVSYIRALQLSQNVPEKALSPDEIGKLEELKP